MPDHIDVNTASGEVSVVPAPPDAVQAQLDAQAFGEQEAASLAAAATAKAQAVATLQASLPANVFDAVMTLAANLNA